MGRTIKRVSPDFDHPLHDIWPGFVNPHLADLRDCPHCANGYNVAGQLLGALWYRHRHDEARQLLLAHRLALPVDLVTFAEGILAIGRVRREGWVTNLDAGDVAALLAEDRLYDLTHVPRTEEQRAAHRAAGGRGYLRESNGHTPTPQEVNAWAQRAFGHDAINRHVCVEARAARYGLDTTCPACGGSGSVPDSAVQARIDAWTPTEPPAGDGWQVWETVSEGSPVSPVFPDRAALVAWLVGQGYSPAAAEAFAARGWVPSMIMNSGPEGTAFYQDIEAATLLGPRREEGDDGRDR